MAPVMPRRSRCFASVCTASFAVAPRFVISITAPAYSSVFILCLFAEYLFGRQDRRTRYLFFARRANFLCLGECAQTRLLYACIRFALSFGYDNCAFFFGASARSRIHRFGRLRRLCYDLLPLAIRARKLLRCLRGIPHTFLDSRATLIYHPQDRLIQEFPEHEQDHSEIEPLRQKELPIYSEC